MDQIERKFVIGKIRRWLRKYGMTSKDIGVDGPLTKSSDDVLNSILDDIEDDNAIEQGQRAERAEREESLRNICDEE